MTEPSDTPPREPYSGFPQPIVPRNGLGTASLVIAVIALVASVSVCGGVALGAVAALMGFTARGRVNRGQADNRSVTTAAIVLGIAAVVISLSMIVFWQSTGLFNEEYQRCLDELQNKHYCEDTYL
jgi:hypothetical protein